MLLQIASAAAIGADESDRCGHRLSRLRAFRAP
jgi:hypothetical protein